MSKENRSFLRFCLTIFLATLLIEVALIFRGASDSGADSTTDISSNPPVQTGSYDPKAQVYFMELGNEKKGELGSRDFQGGNDLGILPLFATDQQGLTFTFNIRSDWISALSISNGEQSIVSPGYFSNPDFFTVTLPMTKIECQMGLFMGQFSVLKSLRIHNEVGFNTIGTWDERNLIIQSTPNDITISSLSMRGSTGAIDAIGVYYSYKKGATPSTEDIKPVEPSRQPMLPVEDFLFLEIGNERVGEVGGIRGFYQGGYDKGTLELSGSNYVKFEFTAGSVVTGLSMSNGKQTVKSYASTFANSFTATLPITKIQCQLGRDRIYTVVKSLRIHTEKEGYQTIGKWDDSDWNIKSTPDGITIHALSLRSDASIDAIGVKYSLNK